MASTNDRKNKKGPPPNKNARNNKVDDSGLDLGDFDFGLDEFDFKPEKDNRRPTTKLAAGMYEGAKSTVSDKHFIEDFIKRALPDGYGQAFNVADSTWSSTKDLYNNAATEMRAPLKEIQRTSKKLLASVENVIPEKLYSRIDKLLTEKESYFDNARSEQDRRKEQDDNEINTTIGEIFKENMRASEAVYAHQKVDRTIREKVEDDQHNNSLLQLETTRAGIDRMVSFQDNFTARYQRKSLELQFKQLFMMRDLTDVTIKSSELSNKFLESITKNTALPDAVKIKTAEVNRQMLKQRLIGGVQNKASEYVRGFGKQLKSNIQNVMTTYTRQMMEGFNMGRQLAESMESAKEFGDGGGPHEMIGGMVGGELAEQAGYRFAQFVSQITDQMPELKRGGSALKYFTTGIPEMFNELAQRGTTQTGWKGTLARMAQQLIPTHMLNSSLGDSPILDSDTHSGFTNGANRALIEVIPGYLSRILHAQRVMMSKNPNIKRIVYNADRGSFTTKDEAVKDAAWRMFGEANTTGARNSLGEFVNSVAGNNKISPAAEGALKDQLMRDSLSANPWSVSNYANKDYYDEKLAPQIRQEIADLFAQAMGMGQGEKFDVRIHDVNRASKLREKYTAMRNNLDDPRDKTKGYIEAGQRELMEALGLIEKGGLTGRMNYNEAFRRIRDANATTEYPDEVWELAEQSGVPAALVAKVIAPATPAPIGAATPPSRATINSGRRAKGISKRRQKIMDQRAVEAAEPPVGAGHGKVNARDIITSINESVTGEGELISAIRANNITAQATTTVELLGDIREMLASGQFGGGGGSGGPPPLPGAYTRRKGFWGGTEHAFRWIGGKLAAGGRAAGTGAGMAWRGGRTAGSFLGRMLGSLGSAAWTGVKGAAGIGWAAGANSAEAALNYISDVRDKQGRVLLEARLMRLGEYFDATTGKVITKLSDIRGPVKDKSGNIVLTAYDFDQQLYNSNGQRVLAGLTAGGRGFLKALGWTSTAPFRAGNFVRTTINGALARMDAEKDIYVRGEPQAPRLLAIKIKSGNYFVQDGDAGTKIVMSWRDCTNTVMDSDGNIVLTTDDIKRGLVDVNGLPFGLTLGGRIGHAAVNVALNIAARLSKFTKWAVAAPKKLMDFLSGVRLDSITNVFVGVGSYIGDQLQNQLDVQNKQLNVLQNIYELLDARLPKPVFGDTDGDGLRDGSWQEKEKNGGGDGEDARDRPGHTGKASSKDNIVANMFGIGGKVKGLWNKLFGKKGGGGGDGDGDCGCGCCGCDGEGGGSDFYVDADGRKRRRSRAPRKDTKGRKRGGWRRNRAARAARFRRRRGLPARPRTGATPRVVRPPPLPGVRRAPRFGRLGRGLARFRPRGASLGGIATGVAMGLGGSYLVDKLGGDDSTGGKIVNGVADTAGMVSTGMMAASAASTLTGGAAAGTAAAGTAAAAGGAGTAATVAGGGVMATIGLPVLAVAAVAAAVGYVGYKAWKKYKYGTYVPVRAFRMAQYGVGYKDASGVEKIVDFEQMVAPHTKMVNGVLDISAEKLSMKEIYEHFGLDDGWFTNNQEERNLFDVWLTRRFKPVYLAWFQAMKTIAPNVALNDADDSLDKDKKLELVKAGSKVGPDPLQVTAGPFGEPLEMKAADVDRALNLAIARIEQDGKGILSGMKRISDASMALTPGMSTLMSPLTDWADKRQEDADMEMAARAREQAKNKPNVTAPGANGASVSAGNAAITWNNGVPTATAGGVSATPPGFMNMQYKPGQGLAAAPPMAPIMLNGTMQLVLDREASDLEGTYGTLKLPDGTVFQTLELPWKNNAARVSCIPTGVYKCARRQTTSFGYAYEVYGVPGRSAILIHAGNSAGSAEHGKKADSQGCILLGMGRGRSGTQKTITNSQAAMKLFYEKMAGRPFQMAIIGGMACIDPNAVREANQNKQANSAYNTTPAQASADAAAAAARTAAGSAGTSGAPTSASTPYSFMNTAYAPGSGMGSGGPAMMNTGYQAGNYSNPGPMGQTVDHPGNGTGGSVNDLPMPPPGAVGAKAIGPLIIAAAKMAGVDPKLMMTMASIESGFRPQVGAGTSSAKGLYQFINSTWQSMLKKYGAKYGISPDAHQFDARANALMGAEFLKENAAMLRKSIGREPTDTDLYMAHFMGAGGAVSALRSPSEAIGAQAMPAAASANRNIYFERDGRPKTMGGVIAHLDKLVRGHRYGSSDIAAIGAGSFNTRSGEGDTGQAASYTASAMPPSATGAPNPALAMAGAPPAGANATPAQYVEAPRPANPAGNDQGAGGTGLVSAGTANSDPQAQMQQAAYRQSYEADVNSRAVQSAQQAQTGGVMEIMNRQLLVMRSMEGHLRDISTKMGNNPAALKMPAQSSEEPTPEAAPTPAAPPARTVEKDGLMVQQSTRSKREAARREANLNAAQNSTPVVDFGLRSDVA